MGRMDIEMYTRGQVCLMRIVRGIREERDPESEEDVRVSQEIGRMRGTGLSRAPGKDHEAAMPRSNSPVAQLVRALH